MAGREEDLGTPGPSRREQEGGRRGKGGMRGAGQERGEGEVAFAGEAELSQSPEGRAGGEGTPGRGEGREGSIHGKNRVSENQASGE